MVAERTRVLRQIWRTASDRRRFEEFLKGEKAEKVLSGWMEATAKHPDGGDLTEVLRDLREDLRDGLRMALLVVTSDDLLHTEGLRFAYERGLAPHPTFEEWLMEEVEALWDQREELYLCMSSDRASRWLEKEAESVVRTEAEKILDSVKEAAREVAEWYRQRVVHCLLEMERERKRREAGRARVRIEVRSYPFVSPVC